MATLEVIVLNYNGERYLGNCLASLQAQSYNDFRLTVVDNHSTDNSVGLVGAAFPKVEVMTLPRNLGFCGGNNAGIRSALQNGAQYVLILNNDTEVPPDFLERLLEGVEDRSDWGLCGCKIVDACGGLWFGGGHLLKHFGTTRVIRNSRFDTVTEVTFLTGCMLLVRREVFERVGLFDERYFMYFEDAELCYRARQAGFKLYYNPQVQIKHWGGSRPRSARAVYFTLRNRRLFIQEHLRDSLSARGYFYASVVSKLALFAVSDRTLFSAVRGAVQDFHAGRFGAGRYEDLS